MTRPHHIYLLLLFCNKLNELLSEAAEKKMKSNNIHLEATTQHGMKRLANERKEK